MERRHGICMLGQRYGTPRWVDDPMQRRDGKCRKTGQEADSRLEVSIMTGGADRGDRNNSFLTISNRSQDQSSH